MKKIFLSVLVFPAIAFAQQVSDSSFHPRLKKTEYAAGKGPVVFIDEGHFNYHTKSGRYKAFSDLIARDGYDVKEYKGTFKKKDLAKGKILVVSNALNKINVNNWYVPTPSAFTKEEIEIVKEWVNNGGSLFLIADHMPMAGAATDLAAVFGFEFTNGFVFHDITRGNAFFSNKNGTLNESDLTRGRDSTERVEEIMSFMGQAFKIPVDAISILTFDENCKNILPDTAWVFKQETPSVNVKGWSQGAYKKFGKGRVVMFGEAAMFTAQVAGDQKTKIGMNDERARENYKLLLNIIHWLDFKF